MASTEQTLILDLDSASLGACVVTEHNDIPVVGLVQRVPVGTGAVRDPAALIPLLKEALSGLIPQYATVNLKQVHVVVASPWFSATLRTLSSKSEKSVRVSTQTVKKVVSDFQKTEQGTHPLEALPITVTVNGYRTMISKPVLGKSLAVTLYESVTDQLFMQTVTEALHAHLPHAQIHFHTTPVVYAETLLRLSGEDHGTVIDVGGELTDVCILSHKTIAFVGSIPEGARSIARAVGGTKDGTLADAASRLTMLARNELAEADMQKTAAALTEASVLWQKGYAAIMEEAGNSVPVPQRIFITGEHDELPWFTRVVTGAETRGLRLAPAVVTPEFFSGALSYGEGGSYDASLALAALFFHMRFGSTDKLFKTAPVLYSVQ